MDDGFRFGATMADRLPGHVHHAGGAPGIDVGQALPGQPSAPDLRHVANGADAHGVRLRLGGEGRQQERLQAGVVAQVKKCTSGWCRVSGNGFDGWIEQQRLWGVYADEKVE